MKDKINVGIVGYGYMGYYHRCKIAEMDKMELLGIFDIEEEKNREAREDKIKTYESFEAMILDENIALIIIATPNDSHYEYAMKALKAGKHVLCEKPAMLALKDLEDVLSEAEKNNKLFTTHQNRRWDKDFDVVKKVIQGKQIGDVWTIYSETYGQRGVCFGWRADPEKGGGMVYDWGIHLIDQLLILFPDRKVISVNAKLRSILTPLVDDYFEIELEFEGDIIAHINIGTFALQNRSRWFVFGDKGTLRLDDFSGLVGGMARIKENVRFFSRVKKNNTLGPSRTMAHLEKQDFNDIPLPIPGDDPLAFYRNLQAAICREEDSLIKPEEMIRDMKIIEKVFESSKKQKSLKVSI